MVFNVLQSFALYGVVLSVAVSIPKDRPTERGVATLGNDRRLASV